MKRRTKDKVGGWPNMRDDTLRAVCDELIRARKKYPVSKNFPSLLYHVSVLKEALEENDAGRMSAAQIYAASACVAAIAIRLLEEGSPPHKYTGNAAAPPFKLTTEEPWHGC